MASEVKRNGTPTGKWLSKPFKDPLTGARRTKQFSSEADAIAYEAACEEALHQGLGYLPEASTITDERSLRHLSKTTLRSHYGQLAGGTRESMANHHRHLMRILGPDFEASKFTKDAVLNVLDQLQHLKPATRNGLRTAVNVMAKEGAERGLCKPFRMRHEPVNNTKDFYLTPEDEDRLLKVCNDKYRLLFRFTILTGLRLAEVLSVSADDIQQQQSNDGGSVGVLRVVGKGSKLRRVPLTPEARQILERQGSWSHLKRYTVQRYIRRAALKVGLPVTFHTLRHTTASRLAAAGANVMHIKDLLGHTSLTTTQNYMHLAPGWGDEVVALIQ